MDTDLFSFIKGDSNVIQTDAIISREITPTGQQYIHITVGNKVLYEFWHNPDKIDNKESPPPKHTGGKKPYVMLMVEEVEKLREQGIPNVEELIGYLSCLGRYVEWGTGRIIHKRSKNPLRYKDLQGLFTCGKRKLDRVLGELKEHGLLTNNQEGYFISQKLIKKGKAKKE